MMRSSYRILRLFGISVELHITFLLLLLGFFMLSWVSDGFLSGVQTLIFFIMLFTIVVLHEISHSVVAILSGIKVSRIILLPIGGIANIEIPEKPVIELMMSLAGPFFNFVVAFSCIFLLSFIVPSPVEIPAMLQGIEDPSMLVSSVVGILILLTYINLGLGLFNLLPAFPMDGGRIFRSILALFMDYTKATRIAVNVGRILAMMMMILGIFGNPWLLLIGALIFFVGGQEYQVVRMKHSLSGLTVAQIAVPQMDYVNGNVTLKEFLDLIAKPGREFYPVINDNREVMGILHLEGLQDLDNKLDEPVRRFVRRPDTVDANLKVADVIMNLMAKEFVLVVDSRNIIGYLTPEHLNEVARFKDIIKR